MFEGDKMKEIAWVKTILTVYRHLKLIAGTIDEMAREEVTRSFVALYHTTMESVERLIELNERKRKLINMKVIIEQGIVQLKKKLDRKIIGLRYIDGMKSVDIIESLQISPRTYFRRKNNAMKEFIAILNQAGYTFSWWVREYGNEKWLMNQFYKNVEKQLEFDNVEKYHMLKCVEQELRSI